MVIEMSDARESPQHRENGFNFKSTPTSDKSFPKPIVDNLTLISNGIMNQDENQDCNSTTSMPSSVSPDFTTETSAKLNRIYPKSMKNAGESFSCQTCGRKFRSPTRFLIHQKGHRRKDILHCTQCGHSFNHYVSLLRHRMTSCRQNCPVYNPSLAENATDKMETNNNETELKRPLVNVNQKVWDLRGRYLPDALRRSFSPASLHVTCHPCSGTLPNIYSYQIHLKSCPKSHLRNRGSRRKARHVSKPASNDPLSPTAKAIQKTFDESVSDIIDTSNILNKAIDCVLPEYIDQMPLKNEETEEDRQQSLDNNAKELVVKMEFIESSVPPKDEMDSEKRDFFGTSSLDKSEPTLPLIPINEENVSETLNSCMLSPVRSPQTQEKESMETSDNFTSQETSRNCPTSPNANGDCEESKKGQNESEDNDEPYLYLSTNENGDPEVIESSHYTNNNGCDEDVDEEDLGEERSKNATCEDDVKPQDIGDESDMASQEKGAQQQIKKPKRRPKVRQLQNPAILKITETGEIISSVSISEGIDVNAAAAAAGAAAIASGTPAPLDRKGRPCSFPCPACPRRFAFQCRLAAHLRCHTNIRPFMCHECGRAFTQKGYLARHAAVHRVDRPFMCRICDRSYKHYGSLVNHRRTHSRLNSSQEEQQNAINGTSGNASNSNYDECESEVNHAQETTTAILVNGQTVILSHGGDLSAAVSHPTTKQTQQSTPKQSRGRAPKANKNNSLTNHQGITSQLLPNSAAGQIHQLSQSHQIVFSQSAPALGPHGGLLNNSNMIVTPVDPNQFQIAARALAGNNQTKLANSNQTISNAANILANLNGQIFVTPEGLVYTGNAVNATANGLNTVSPNGILNGKPNQHQSQPTFITTASNPQIQQILPVNKIEDVLTAVQLDQSTFQQHQLSTQQQAFSQQNQQTNFQLYSPSNHQQHSSMNNSNNSSSATVVTSSSNGAIGSITNQNQQVLVSTGNGQQNQQTTVITLGQLQAAFNQQNNLHLQQQQQKQSNQQLLHQHQQALQNSSGQQQAHLNPLQQWSFANNEMIANHGLTIQQDVSQGQHQQANGQIIHTADGTAMLTCLPVTFQTNSNSNSDPNGHQQIQIQQQNGQLHSTANFSDLQAAQQQQLLQQHHQQQMDQSVNNATHQVLHLLQPGSNGTQSIVTFPGYYLPTLSSGNQQNTNSVQNSNS